jgi:hypothetical protein
MRKRQMEESHKENCEVAGTMFVQEVNKILILIQISKYLGTLRMLQRKNRWSNKKSQAAVDMSKSNNLSTFLRYFHFYT